MKPKKKTLAKVKKLNPAKGSLPDGTTCQFRLREMDPDDFYDEEVDGLPELVKQCDGKTCTVTFVTGSQMEAPDDEPDQDFEYYDLDFGDGMILPGVSGYHLTIKKK